ncbi:succinylglutamate desuccinylase/aspartoacylase domain-containing protein [Methanobacterium spitsbergense]|uniref:Succinylglutamate desuccinylase/aspartoacylase family protein n=1 Tax=Methanobacterium spitsbergense TaxID=2874285 RepID=A0A8T5USE6_9EURY|nr:succinylglutamate desuccinylase/aspartoacylase family protein [Methanobacterium spitsbergense]MBZ2166698.1 succinylglutamate desuccinylase/aspartoacylase family protein [Methanobacterium spitsbergense]
MKKNLLIILMILIVVPLIIQSSSSAATPGISSIHKGVSHVPNKNLIVSHISVPLKGIKGCKIVVSNTIKNRGNTSYYSIWVNYYLKNIHSHAITYLGRNHSSNMAAGASKHHLTSLYISPKMNVGNYYLLTVLSTKKFVSKYNIGNNYRYTKKKIKIIGPEYIIFNSKIGGDVTRNSQIDSNIPKTDFAKTIFSQEKKGSVMLKFGDGHGPILLISAGIHGNETAANIGIMKYLEYIKDKNIHGTLYVIPFAIPLDTELNTRFYKGIDPNRIANVKGSPAWKIVHFAKNKGIKYILDIHSGGGVTPEGYLYLNPSTTGSKEDKWVSYIANVSGCTKQVQPLGTGMLRTEAYNLGINTITLEVERDNTDMSIAAETELKMIMAACKYFKFQ